MYTMNTDGGSRNNPGNAAIGIVLKNENNEVIEKMSKYIGVATNNVAEYTAILEGLNLCLTKNISEVKCVLDSELVVKQLNGQYKVKDQTLLQFNLRVKDLSKKFSKISFNHVLRAENKEADKLVNEELDRL